MFELHQFVVELVGYFKECKPVQQFGDLDADDRLTHNFIHHRLTHNFGIGYWRRRAAPRHRDAQ